MRAVVQHEPLHARGKAESARSLKMSAAKNHAQSLSRQDGDHHHAATWTDANTKDWCSSVMLVLHRAGHFDAQIIRTAFTFEHEPQSVRLYFIHLPVAARQYLASQLPKCVQICCGTHADDMARDPEAVVRLMNLQTPPDVYMRVPAHLRDFWTILRRQARVQARSWTFSDYASVLVSVLLLAVAFYWLYNLA